MLILSGINTLSCFINLSSQLDCHMSLTRESRPLPAFCLSPLLLLLQPSHKSAPFCLPSNWSCDSCSWQIACLVQILAYFPCSSCRTYHKSGLWLSAVIIQAEGMFCILRSHILLQDSHTIRFTRWIYPHIVVWRCVDSGCDFQPLTGLWVRIFCR